MSKTRRALAVLLVLAAVLGVVGGSAAWLYLTAQPDYQLRRAQEAIARGDWDRAEHIATGLEAKGYTDHAHLLRGEGLLGQCLYAQALAEFNRIQDQGAIRLRAVVLSGQCLVQLKSFSEAERSLRFALSEQPENVDAHRGLAALYYDLGAVMRAAYHCLEWARLDPHDGRPYRFLGLIYKELPDENDQAITFYQEALARELSPAALEDVREELAECLVKQSSYARALELLDQCHPRSGDVPKTTALRAESFWALGRDTEARALLDRALADEPGSPELLRVRAKMHLAANEPKAAAALFERVLADNRNDYEARFQLAQAYELLGRRTEAAAQRRLGLQTQEDLKELTKLNRQLIYDPWNATARERLAAVYRKLGRPDIAAGLLRAAAAHAAPGHGTPPPPKKAG